MPEMPDFDSIMQMAQNAQAELQKAQDNLDKIEVEGAAGGGMVKIRATAKGRILAVDIDESCLQPSEKTMVEDLVAAAINDARAKADAAAAERNAEDAGQPAAAARVQATLLDKFRTQSHFCGMCAPVLAGRGADGFARRNAGFSATHHAPDGPCRARAWLERDRAARADGSTIRTNWKRVADDSRDLRRRSNGSASSPATGSRPWP